MKATITKALARWIPLVGFKGSDAYWKGRYRLGGDSGSGSGGASAAYKAAVLNAFVVRYGVRSVIEFGCGDGRQLSLAEYPRYLGVDISRNAIDRCNALFSGDPNKSFLLLDSYAGQTADLAMSLDVLFHLVEDRVYDAYLERLFAAAERYVAIYSSNQAAGSPLPHVRHRAFAADVAERFPGFESLPVHALGLPDPPATTGVPMVFRIYRRTG